MKFNTGDIVQMNSDCLPALDRGYFKGDFGVVSCDEDSYSDEYSVKIDKNKHIWNVMSADMTLIEKSPIIINKTINIELKGRQLTLSAESFLKLYKKLNTCKKFIFQKTGINLTEKEREKTLEIVRNILIRKFNFFEDYLDSISEPKKGS